MARCSTCNGEIIHVRDDFTGATFSVDAEPSKSMGFVLGRPAEGERNPRADRTVVELYTPHEQTCEQKSVGAPVTGEGEEDDE